MSTNKNKTPIKTISDPNAPRRCPYCQSDKWKRIETIPTSPETIGEILLMLYECKKCTNEFFAVEKAQSKLVKSADKCFFCNSKYVEKISKPNADVDLYFCKKCRCYMGVQQ